MRSLTTDYISARNRCGRSFGTLPRSRLRNCASIFFAGFLRRKSLRDKRDLFVGIANFQGRQKTYSRLLKMAIGTAGRTIHFWFILLFMGFLEPQKKHEKF